MDTAGMSLFIERAGERDGIFRVFFYSKYVQMTMHFNNITMLVL